MSEKQDIATRSETEMQRNEPGAAAGAPGVVLRPPADVFEDSDGITLRLDMPGVSKDRLNIQTDKNTLRIDGDVQIAMPQGMEAVHAEVHSTHYRRSFALSGELESHQAEANLKDGVVTVRIPKRADVRPRRIEVRTT